jgi:hypothetical protein
MRILARWTLPVIGALLLAGCSPKLDTTREFAMALNGAPYSSRMKPPIGCAQEIEAGFSTQYRYTILFPCRLPSPIPRPGLEIAFEPDKVVLGEEMAFGAGDVESGIGVEYCPVMGHKSNQGILLTFSSHRSDGGGTIRFDALEPEIGGRVKGTILHATLYGYYEDAHTAEITEPKAPRKLELWNFPFEVTLRQAPY